jgi:hypothetical protein
VHSQTTTNSTPPRAAHVSEGSTQGLTTVLAGEQRPASLSLQLHQVLLCSRPVPHTLEGVERHAIYRWRTVELIQEWQGRLKHQGILENQGNPDCKVCNINTCSGTRSCSYSKLKYVCSAPKLDERKKKKKKETWAKLPIRC